MLATKKRRPSGRHLLNLSLFFINASILSEYLQISQNAATTAAAIITQIKMPHQVLNGINPTEYAVVKTEIALVIVIIIKKYGQVMEDNPAIKHSTSSGNIGNKNINERIR